MTDVLVETSEPVSPPPKRTLGGMLGSLEIDTRLLGMLGALVVIWIGFHILSGGTFLTPRNLWNLSVQTAAVGIMATGMVLIIVERHIDLSVGSVLGFLGVAMALIQTDILPGWFGGLGHPAIWITTLIIGLLLGGLIGAIHGFIIAYGGVPSFIVTLGGLLIWRGLAWGLASGQTIAPMDTTFQLLGGGSRGRIGGPASWAVGLVACLGIVALLLSGRRQRRKFGFGVRPIWAEVTLAIVGCIAVLGAIFVLNQYPMPEALAEQYAAARGIEVPPGGIALGLANPVLIAIGVALVMTVIATRRRFGRYVFAIGGNPEAAQLGGIKTRWVTLKSFVLMGVLVGVGAAVSVARLNAATSGLGTLQELYVIAAAVIGGTSLGGGVGTIAGAVLGALVMQSLQSGMVLMGVQAPLQDVVVGIVLVLAVGIDTAFRKRVSR